MITQKDVEAAENVERRCWELQHEAMQLQSELCTVVHNTAQLRREALAKEVQLQNREDEARPERLAYARARSGVLGARLRLQLVRAAEKAKQLRAELLEFGKEIDLGALLDSSPE